MKHLESYKLFESDVDILLDIRRLDKMSADFISEEDLIDTVLIELTDIGFYIKEKDGHFNGIYFSYFSVKDDKVNIYIRKNEPTDRLGYVIIFTIPTRYDNLEYEEIDNIVKPILNHMEGTLQYYGDHKIDHHYIEDNLYVFIEK
jgi:hypothetical protein